GDVDDVGADTAHVLVVEAPLADHVAAVVLDDDVGRRTEGERQLAAARGAEVERDAQLPARGVVEGPRAVDGVGLDRHAAEEIDVGARLDLDDLGGVIGTPSRRPSARTSARARPASASLATARTTSPFMRRKSGTPQCSPSSASGLPRSATNARHCRGEPGSTRTQPSAVSSTWYAPSALRGGETGSIG